MGVSENRGPQYSALNSRILIIRGPKIRSPYFRKLPYILLVPANLNRKPKRVLSTYIIVEKPSPNPKCRVQGLGQLSVVSGGRLLHGTHLKLSEDVSESLPPDLRSARKALTLKSETCQECPYILPLWN